MPEKTQSQESNSSNRVYLSFLGAGIYNSCRYALCEPFRPANSDTCYVQVAEQELFGPFSKVCILLTKTSAQKHQESLQSEMEKRGILTEFLEIPEDLNPREQVKTLQTIFEQVPAGCQLTIDMTHGFRAVPVMLSSAIGFLQSTGHARVEHVLYGAHDQTFSLAGSEYAPIYDMVEFYQITELAEGVSRLVELGDARKLAQFARRSQPLIPFPDVAEEFESVSDALRNVDMMRVQESVEKAIEKLGHFTSGNPEVHPIAGILIEKVKAHFEPLLQYKFTECYDIQYFRFMQNYVEMLLKHRLYMQAYTVMQETLSSFGVFAESATPKLKQPDWKTFRSHYADAFLPAMRHWKEKDKKHKIEKTQISFNQVLEKLENAGAFGIIRRIDSVLQNVRNGFNHGWTGSTRGIEKELKNAIKKLTTPPQAPISFLEIGRELNKQLLEVAEKYFGQMK